MVVLVVAVALAAAALVGWTWSRGDGRLRRGSGEVLLPPHVALEPGAFGPVATLLLFTSRTDQRTPPVRTALQALADRYAGVRLAEVDLGARGDLAGRYAVTRTPTVFVLDGDARLRARVAGAASPTVLAAALESALPRAD